MQQSGCRNRAGQTANVPSKHILQIMALISMIFKGKTSLAHLSDDDERTLAVAGERQAHDPWPFSSPSNSSSHHHPQPPGCFPQPPPGENWACSCPCKGGPLPAVYLGLERSTPGRTPKPSPSRSHHRVQGQVTTHKSLKAHEEDERLITLI